MFSFPHARANTHVFSAQIQHTSIQVQEHTISFQNSRVSSAKRLFFNGFFFITEDSCFYRKDSQQTQITAFHMISVIGLCMACDGGAAARCL